MILYVFDPEDSIDVPDRNVHVGRSMNMQHVETMPQKDPNRNQQGSSKAVTVFENVA